MKASPRLLRPLRCRLWAPLLALLSSRQYPTPPLPPPPPLLPALPPLLLLLPPLLTPPPPKKKEEEEKKKKIRRKKKKRFRPCTSRCPPATNLQLFVCCWLYGYSRPLTGVQAGLGSILTAAATTKQLLLSLLGGLPTLPVGAAPTAVAPSPRVWSYLALCVVPVLAATRAVVERYILSIVSAYRVLQSFTDFL
jgi:hypothetical protein